jgi:hypothetical protein
VAVVLVLGVAILAVGALMFVGTTGDGDTTSSALSSTTVAGGPAGLTRPKVPEGFELFADSDGSFAFVVPEGWETVMLDKTSLRRARDRLEEEHPQFAESIGRVEPLVAAGGMAFASELEAPDGFLANVNLLRASRTSESISDIAASGRLQLEARGSHVLTTTPATVGQRTGVIFEYQIATPLGPTMGYQLYVASGYRVYALTVSGLTSQSARTIIQSLRVP